MTVCQHNSLNLCAVAICYMFKLIGIYYYNFDIFKNQYSETNI